jgi:hypothetical protein
VVLTFSPYVEFIAQVEPNSCVRRKPIQKEYVKIGRLTRSSRSPEEKVLAVESCERIPEEAIRMLSPALESGEFRDDWWLRAALEAAKDVLQPWSAPRLIADLIPLVVTLPDKP